MLTGQTSSGQPAESQSRQVCSAWGSLRTSPASTFAARRPSSARSRAVSAESADSSAAARRLFLFYRGVLGDARAAFDDEGRTAGIVKADANWPSLR